MPLRNASEIFSGSPSAPSILPLRRRVFGLDNGLSAKYHNPYP